MEFSIRRFASSCKHLGRKTPYTESMITALHTTWCQVSDMDRSVAFYRDLLGLKAGYISPYWSDFDLGNGKIALHPRIQPGEGPTGNAKGWYLGVQTADIAALNAALTRAGVTITESFHEVPGGVVLTFTDPDNNLIQAIQVGLRLEDLEREIASAK